MSNLKSKTPGIRDKTLLTQSNLANRKPGYLQGDYFEDI